MLWIITKDLINERMSAALGEPHPKTYVGRLSTRSASRRQQYANADTAYKAALLEAYKAECDYEFRLYDDDGILYYEGLCKDLDDQGSDSAFEPLDWAMSDSGCTRMDYRKRGVGEWKTL